MGDEMTELSKLKRWFLEFHNWCIDEYGMDSRTGTLRFSDPETKEAWKVLEKSVYESDNYESKYSELTSKYPILKNRKELGENFWIKK